MAAVVVLVACAEPTSDDNDNGEVASPTTATTSTMTSDENRSSDPPSSELATLEAELNTTDMAISINRGSNQVVKGGEITYEFVATNHGPNPASEVIVTIDLSALVSAQTIPSNCTGGSEQLLTCSYKEIPARSDVTIDLVVRVIGDAASKIQTSATVLNVAGPDPVPSNNQDTEEVEILRSP